MRTFSRNCSKNHFVKKENVKQLGLCFSTFVSEHYQVEKEEILSLLKTMETETRQKSASGPYEVKECKLCNKKNRSMPDNIWKLNVRQNGSYHCYRCDQKGSWFDLKRKAGEKFIYTSVSDNLDVDSIVAPTAATNKTSILKPGKSKIGTAGSEDEEKKYLFPSQKQMTDNHYSLFPSCDEKGTEHADTPARRAAVKTYLNDVRGLNDEILAKYGVGLATQQFLGSEKGEWRDHTCVTFPWIVLDKDFKRETVADECKVDLEPLMTQGEDDCMIIRMKYR